MAWPKPWDFYIDNTNSSHLNADQMWEQAQNALDRGYKKTMRQVDEIMGDKRARAKLRQHNQL